MPDCDGVQLARPTKSLGLYLQQIGRCMRPMEGKDYAIVLDNVGLYEIFGSPKVQRNWSLAPNQNIKLETDEAITRLCASRNRDKPSESNDLNLVILEDVEIMTIDEIKAQIKELEEAILECEKSLEKTTLEIRQQSLRKEIYEYKQNISDLKINLQQALERASQEKIEEVVNECKDYFQMFINDERLNNDVDKIKFMDRLINVITQEKQTIIMTQKVILKEHIVDPPNNLNKPVVIHVEVISDRRRKEGVAKNFVNAICELIKKLQSIDVLIDLNLQSNGTKLICNTLEELDYQSRNGEIQRYNNNKIEITYSNREKKFFYINTQTDTPKKRNLLEQIEKKLRVDMNIDEIIRE